MLKMKRLLVLLGLSVTLCVSAQDYFNHMDFGVNVSSTGIGADIAMPVGNYVRLRTGFTYMPKFTVKSNFDVKFMGKVSDEKLQKMKDMMENFTGQVMQENVDMLMSPKCTNFKFLVDVFPIPGNKHWSVTAGFYAGPSRIGEAENDESAIPTLSAVNMYNAMYLKAYKGDNIAPIEGASIIPPEYYDKFVEIGMMGMPLGKFSDGSKAVMIPNKNSMAKATMEVSKFRPYVGLGYNTTLSRDGKWKLAVDAGALFWGGNPHIYVDNVYKVSSDPDECPMTTWNNEEGRWEDILPTRIDLTRDVSEIPGKVGDMVNTVKKFKCWPVVSVTFSHKLF